MMSARPAPFKRRGPGRMMMMWKPRKSGASRLCLCRLMPLALALPPMLKPRRHDRRNYIPVRESGPRQIPRRPRPKGRKDESPMNGDRIERVVLYGSRARGDALPDSDYDVAVFLNGMTGVSDRWAELDRLAGLRVTFL